MKIFYCNLHIQIEINLFFSLKRKKKTNLQQHNKRLNISDVIVWTNLVFLPFFLFTIIIITAVVRWVHVCRITRVPNIAIHGWWGMTKMNTLVLFLFRPWWQRLVHIFISFWQGLPSNTWTFISSLWLCIIIFCLGAASFLTFYRWRGRWVENRKWSSKHNLRWSSVLMRVRHVVTRVNIWFIVTFFTPTVMVCIPVKSYKITAEVCILKLSYHI